MRGLYLFCLLVLTCSGCEINRAAPGVEAGAAGDARVINDRILLPPDAGTTWSCSMGGQGFVFDRVLLPTDSTRAEKYALKFMGKKYNFLGGILALIHAAAPSLPIQASLDESVCAGRALQLLCLQPNAMARGQAWPATAACCAKAPCFNSSGGTCGSAARAKCFSGASTFKPNPVVTGNFNTGDITAGVLKLGPGKMTISLPFAAKPLLVALKYVTITGTITSNRITSGVLSGGMDQSDLRTRVLPAIAAALTALYKNPGTAPNTKTQLKTLFDTNKDGTITTKELENNPLIKTFLDGDVDVDGDGLREFSLGLGFTAVSAKLKLP